MKVTINLDDHYVHATGGDTGLVGSYIATMRCAGVAELVGNNRWLAWVAGPAQRFVAVEHGAAYMTVVGDHPVLLVRDLEGEQP